MDQQMEGLGNNNIAVCMLRILTGDKMYYYVVILIQVNISKFIVK